MTNPTKQPSKSRKKLPKKDVFEQGVQRATLCQQFVRCGRANCHCACGTPQELHGPYLYWFWREHGRLRKKYVPKASVAEARCALDQNRGKFEQQREQCKQSLSIWRHLQDEIREIEGFNGCNLEFSEVPFNHEPR